MQASSASAARRWRAKGLKSLFPLDDTAVMGLSEVVPRIPAILRRVRQAADYALEPRVPTRWC